MKLVYLKDIWIALGKPATFKAECGYECEAKGVVFTVRPSRKENGRFCLVLGNKDLWKIMMNLDGVAKWVPPFEAWKNQPVTNFKSLEDVMNDLVKEKVNES